MAKKRERSVFWVVSTHVCTTGFALPAAAALLCLAALSAKPQPPLAAFLIFLAVEAFAYIGGTFYSLSYLRKVALVRDPTACILPSIITFVALALGGLAANVGRLFTSQKLINPVIGVCILVVFYAVVCVAFARITRRGFSKLEPYTPAS